VTNPAEARADAASRLAEQAAVDAATAA